MSALQKTRDPIAIALHVCFATAIVCQLLTSLIMHRPYLGRTVGLLPSDAFFVHRYIGLCALTFVLLYWLRVCFRPEKWLHLFPWVTQVGRRAIWADVKSLFCLRLPEYLHGGLAGTVHGLGLLLVTFVGFCGLFLFIFLPHTHQVPETVYVVKELHANFAYWIWWFVGGHVFMAAWHAVKRRF